MGRGHEGGAELAGWLTLDDRTQGYALIEYPTLPEAQAAIRALDGAKLLDQTIQVDFAFVRPPPSTGKGKSAGSGGGGGEGLRVRGAAGGRGRSRSRERSRSPGRR